MNFLFSVFITFFASLSNGIEPSTSLLNGTYQSLINKAAMEIFDKNITLPIGLIVDNKTDRNPIRDSPHPATGTDILK